jgi:hypothetical protein
LFTTFDKAAPVIAARNTPDGPGDVLTSADVSGPSRWRLIVCTTKNRPVTNTGSRHGMIRQRRAERRRITNAISTTPAAIADATCSFTPARIAAMKNTQAAAASHSSHGSAGSKGSGISYRSASRCPRRQ